jgi:hypothetical protein
MRLILVGLLCAGLGTALPAFAGSWSIGADIGAARLRPGDSIGTKFDYLVDVRVDYWFAPQYAIELSDGYADGHLDLQGYSVDRNLRALRLGVRGQWSLGSRAFLVGRAGIDHNHIWRYSIEPTAFPNPVNGGTDTFDLIRRHRTDNAPYAGFGLGWRWDAHWSSTIEIAREFNHASYHCDPAPRYCSSTNPGRFDTATAGIEYRFDP